MKHQSSKIVKLFSSKETGNLSQISVLLVLILVLLSIPTIIYAASVDSFSFHFKALAGESLKWIEPGSEVRKLSLFKLLHDLSATSTLLDDEKLTTGAFLGISYMQGTTVLFSLILPLTLVLFLFVLLFIPMNLRDQKIFYYMIRVVSSLSSLDVFAVSIIAAVAQLEQFSLFIQGDQCNFIVNHFDTDCFRVTTELLPASWILFSSAILILIVSQLVFAICEQALLEREARAIALYMRIDEDESIQDMERRISF